MRCRPIGYSRRTPEACRVQQFLLKLSSDMTAAQLGPDGGGRVADRDPRCCCDDGKTQAEVGVDVINDGEASKIGYSTYVRERLSGFSGKGRGLTIWDLHDVPEFAQRSLAGLDPQTPACTGPIVYQGRAALEEDIANLRTATEELTPTELFMTAASPGVISIFLENQYYSTDEEYWEAIAEAMRVEYEAIVAAGFVLQLDAPDLAMGRHVNTRLLNLDEFRRQVAVRVELLNHACRNHSLG